MSEPVRFGMYGNGRPTPCIYCPECGVTTASSNITKETAAHLYDCPNRVRNEVANG